MNIRLNCSLFPTPPKRLSHPEARGLRHLAFSVDNLDDCISYLRENGIVVEAIRVDEITGCRFTFFSDPDNLPLELYETQKSNPPENPAIKAF